MTVSIKENTTEQSRVEDEVQPQTAPSIPKRTGINAKKIFGFVFGAVALILLGVFGMRWLNFSTTHEETDDAYITGHLHPISSRIPGTVEHVYVDDNEHVKAGQLLATLDPRDYKAQLDQARANLLQAQRAAEAAKTTIEFQDTTAEGQTANARGGIIDAEASISRALAAQREAEANIQGMDAQIAARDAELERAKLDYERYDSLQKDRAVTTSQRDAAKRDYLVAVENRKTSSHNHDESMARLEQARQSVANARAKLTQAHAQMQLARASGVQSHVDERQFRTNLASIDSAKAAVEQAELNLSYTRIVAPTAGRIGKKTLEEGQRLDPGAQILVIVSDDVWVLANFKETQLKKMRPNQEVEIKVDACPEHVFKGNILNFAPASGTSFAVLPTDNATGNFTKIVQRLPVKIVFSKDSTKGYDNALSPGLSVLATVDLKAK